MNTSERQPLLRKKSKSRENEHDPVKPGASASANQSLSAQDGGNGSLQKRWHFWSLLSFSITNLSSWEYATSLLGSAFVNGGPSTIVYGFVLVFAAMLSINASLAEMASMYPVAGGQYAWTYQFAPKRLRIVLSYIQGGTTNIAWQVFFVGTTLFLARSIQGMIILNDDTYVSQPWHTFMLMIFFGLISFLLLAWGDKVFPILQTMVMILHGLLFFALAIVLLWRSDGFADFDSVWHNFQNNGGWSSDGISFCIGLLLPAYVLVGAEVVVYMAEETDDPSRNIPIVFMLGLIINAISAFAFMIVCLYCIKDLDAVLNTPTGFAILEIFRQATGSTAIATTLNSLMLIVQIACCFPGIAAASRLVWSFSRENGLPGSNTFARIHPQLQIPFNATVLTFAISIFLSTIVLWSTIAIDAITSLSVVAVYITYLIPIGCFLWYRIRHAGAVKLGAWNMGRFGIPVNIVAMGSCVFFIAVLPLPPILPVTVRNMNWAGPIILTVFLVLGVDWTVRARKQYSGPETETTTDVYGEGEGATRSIDE